MYAPPTPSMRSAFEVMSGNSLNSEKSARIKYAFIIKKTMPIPTASGLYCLNVIITPMINNVMAIGLKGFAVENQ